MIKVQFFRRKIHNRDLSFLELQNTQRSIEQKLQKFPTYYIEFSPFYLNETGWTHTKELMGEVNLSAADAMHMYTAMASNCKLFVTNDTHLRKSAKDFFHKIELDIQAVSSAEAIELLDDEEKEK